MTAERFPTNTPGVFLVEVKRDKDAIGALCLDCGLLRTVADWAPWRWQGTRAMHLRSGHRRMVSVAIEVGEVPRKTIAPA